MQHDAQHSTMHGGGSASHAHHYRMFWVNVVGSGAAMYLAMFTMIAGWDEFVNNLNMAYMALIMLAPMAILMIVTMPAMLPRRRLNLVLIGGFALAGVLSFAALRAQVPIGDRQFLRAMIPHHSGAILMCEQARLRDPEVVSLCGEIVSSQRREIDQMQQIRDRM